MHDGQAAAADAVYRADLQQYLRNPWSLLGLAQAMERQGDRYNKEEVRGMLGRFRQAWERADVGLRSSCPMFFP